MKLLECPVIGKRPISEFDYMGEIRIPPLEADEKTWSEYVFNRKGAPCSLKEAWYHRPTGRWYVVVRNTLTDEIEAHVDISEVQYELPA